MATNSNPLPPTEESINKPKHGGGPKTPEGKARSAQNAYKHGLYTTKHALLKTESPIAFQAHLSAYYARYCPADQPEKDLVYELAQSQWLLNRYTDMESQAIDNEIDSLETVFTPDAAGQSVRTTIAGQRAVEKPLLNYLARRIASLVRQRAAALKALSDLRKKHPNLDPAPDYLPDPLHPVTLGQTEWRGTDQSVPRTQSVRVDRSVCPPPATETKERTLPSLPQPEPNITRRTPYR